MPSSFTNYDAKLTDIRSEIKADHTLNKPNLPPLTDAELDAAVADYIKNVKVEARNRLAGTLGMTFVFAGATGLPLWWMVSGIMNAMHAAFGDDDEEWDFDNWFKNWCAETFGGYAGDSISRGVVSQTFGVNVADRMGLNDLWFRDSRKSPDEVSAMQAFLVDLMGPSVGLGITAAESLKQVKEGHIWRGMETASPALLKNAMKGIRISDTFGEGRATNLKGNVLVDDFGIGEVVGQTMGFSPERLAQRQKANIEMKTAEQEIIHRRQSLLNAYFMAFDNQDSDMMERVTEKIARFNKSNPGLGIKGSNLSRSIRDKIGRAHV